MVSVESSPELQVLVAGEYTKAQLQRVLGASSKTIDRYRKRFNLPDKEGPSQAIRIIVSAESAEAISNFVSERAGHGSGHELECLNSGLVDVMDKSRSGDSELRIHELEKHQLRLEGDLKEKEALLSSKNDILLSKQNEIETLKASLKTVEATISSLQASLMLLERENNKLQEQLQPSIPMITTHQPKKLWDKVKFIFGK